MASRSECSTVTLLAHLNTFQGSIVSAIGRGINAIISAIANVLETIVYAITTVKHFLFLETLVASHI